MNRTHWILTGIIVISLTASVIALTLRNTTEPSYLVNELSECNTIVNNGPGSIGIVYLASEENARKYTDYFLKVTPYDEYSSLFSFYFITPEQYSPKCELYKGIALYCHNSENTKAAGACPHDYITVLNPSPRSIRSSAFSGTMSLNDVHPLSVYPHEFGHVFANFAEEYISNARIPRDSNNCQSTCDPFSSLIPEANCHEGCTKDSYFREFDEGFMRTLSSDRYGPYNEQLLRDIIEEKTKEAPSDSPLTGNAILTPEDCRNQQYYLIEGTYQNNNVEITSKERVTGCAPASTDYGILNYQVTTDTDQILAEGTLLPQIFIDSGEEKNGQIEPTPEVESPNEFILTVPVQDDSQQVDISDDSGNNLASIPLDRVGAQPCQI